MRSLHHITAILLFCCLSIPTSAAVADSIPELPLPAVPPTLKAPTERANYIITHFWDAMDFNDTQRSHHTVFIEQNFSNFISVFPYAADSARHMAVQTLLKKAEADSTAYALLRDVTEKYLYEPESPLLSEDYYMIFLEQYIADAHLDRYVLLRLHRQLDATRKNRPGMTAADFAFTTREGDTTTLHQIATDGDLLLMFYDPDCDHCTETVAELQASEATTQAIANGKLKVLAIYSGDDHNLWQQTATAMPANWIVGYENGTLQDKGSYVLRAMPTLYLLDQHKKVLMKDAQPVFFIKR